MHPNMCAEPGGPHGVAFPTAAASGVLMLLGHFAVEVRL